MTTGASNESLLVLMGLGGCVFFWIPLFLFFRWRANSGRTNPTHHSSPSQSTPTQPTSQSNYSSHSSLDYDDARAARQWESEQRREREISFDEPSKDYRDPIGMEDAIDDVLGAFFGGRGSKQDDDDDEEYR